MLRATVNGQSRPDDQPHGARKVPRERLAPRKIFIARGWAKPMSCSGGHLNLGLGRLPTDHRWIKAKESPWLTTAFDPDARARDLTSLPLFHQVCSPDPPATHLLGR
jgi:hypothetical protein